MGGEKIKSPERTTGNLESRHSHHFPIFCHYWVCASHPGPLSCHWGEGMDFPWICHGIQVCHLHSVVSVIFLDKPRRIVKKKKKKPVFIALPFTMVNILAIFCRIPMPACAILPPLLILIGSKGRPSFVIWDTWQPVFSGASGEHQSVRYKSFLKGMKD